MGSQIDGHERSSLPGCLTDEAASGPDTRDLDINDFLTVRLRRLSRAMDRQTKQLLADFELTVIEWRCMALLVGRRLSAARLADMTGFDKSQISRALGNLTRRGLVTRLGSEAGSKAVILEAAPEGRALYARILPVGRARQRTLLGRLSVDQRARLYEAMDILSRHLQAAEESEPSPARQRAPVPAE